MENLKVKRTVIRRRFTKQKNELHEQIKAVPFDEDQLTYCFEVVSQTANALFEIDEQIGSLWLQREELDQSEYEKDSDDTESYRQEWIKVRLMYEKLIKSRDEDLKQDSSSTTTSICGHSKKILRLPKLDLPKFDGNAKNWIPFWGLFKKIDSDENMDDDEKFAYLFQHMEPHSPARALVASFPATGNNYHEAVKQLKARYARDELLIEIYVRELLALVLDQVKGTKHTIAALYDKLKTQLRALDTLGVTSDKYAAMLYPLVESSLPTEILRVWERQRTKGQVIDILNNLLDFMKVEVESEERIQLTRDLCLPLQDPLPTAACLADINQLAPSLDKNDKPSCLWCDKTNHSSLECYKAQRMLLKSKLEIVEKKKACNVCLRIGHSGKKCKTRTRCMICTKRHASLLCPDLKQPYKSTPSTSAENSNFSSPKTTFLQTLVVKIGDKKVRAFIDSGAQRSYITKDLATSLRLNPIGNESITHSLFGDIKTEAENHQVYNIMVNSIVGPFQLQLRVLDKIRICSYIPRVQPNESLKRQLRLNNIKLCDSEGDEDISLLIGADFAGHIATGTIIPVSKDLFAINTKFGWTIQGVTEDRNFNTTLISLHSSTNIGHLWDLETIGIENPEQVFTKKQNEEVVMIDFLKNIRVNDEKRYEVHLPWKIDHRELLDNKQLAFKRLKSTTKRLEMLGELSNYEAVFKEWLELGIIEIEPNEEVYGHYLPHQAVIKNSSLTTRVRPVFDASAKDRNGTSINSCLEKGINFLELIPILLTRFRLHTIALTSDIKKAFLQISITESDRKLLRFLWWSDSEKTKTITYRHCRVVFGLTCSPFLLAATIKYHVENMTDKHKEISKRLIDSFYVDNCVISLESKTEAEEFITKSKQLMMQGGFDLRGWISGPIRCKGTEEQSTVSILGVLWDPVNYTIQCRIDPLKESHQKVTLRELLSVTHKIFDPIGFTCPVTLVPKLLLQRSWKLHLSWDSELPSDICKEYELWLKDINLLSECFIPRRLTTHPIQDSKRSLHIFCDASSKAYASCIFLRSETSEETNVQLVLGKSRVAPVKPVTTPRLELLAALMSTRLYLQASKALQLDCEAYFWTDSSVVLAWIINEKVEWSVFIRNRVNEIRQYTKRENWRHIAGYLNPADLPSRGCQAKILLQNRWWEGPAWLKKSKVEWPITKNIHYDEVEINKERVKKTVCVEMSTINENFSLRLERISSYKRLVCIIAWIVRFVNNCQQKNVKGKGPLSFEEKNKGEKLIFRLIQIESFHTTPIKGVKNVETFKDNDGIWRVKTRLTLSDEDKHFILPVLLPGKNKIVTSLVLQYHQQYNHAGVHILTAILRDTLWIIGGKRLIRKAISMCIICKRYSAKHYETPTAPLPQNRVKNAAVFEVTGIDTAGPLFLKGNIKCWLLLFTCAVYRAVHLEIITSLSTECFLMALRRFIARRGRCQIIYTDNGTNFVGAENQLSKIDWEKVEEFSVTSRIKWHFNPPGAPWWGGWWERLIGLVKQLLRRTLGRATLNLIELETVLCDIESVINSRPLTYITENDAMRPLSPSCFLHSCSSGSTGYEVPDLDSIDAKSLNLRIKYVQKLRQDLRQRFRTEYLALLVGRARQGTRQCQIGDVVLLETEAKRSDWPLGVILDIFPGQDGCTRVAKLRTAFGERLRPVQKLYPMEFSRCSSDQPDVLEFEDQPNGGDNMQPLPTTTRSRRRVLPPRRLDL